MLAILYIMGTLFLRRVYFGAYLPLCLNITIKGRLYANHIIMNGIKASLYVTKQTQGQVYVPQTRSS